MFRTKCCDTVILAHFDNKEVVQGRLQLLSHFPILEAKERLTRTLGHPTLLTLDLQQAAIDKPANFRLCGENEFQQLFTAMYCKQLIREKVQLSLLALS